MNPRQWKELVARLDAMEAMVDRVNKMSIHYLRACDDRILSEDWSDFRDAVVRHLGLDPEAAQMRGWGDDGHVDVRFHVPAEDLYGLLRGDCASSLPASPEPSELISLQEAAKRLRLDPKTVRRYVANGRLTGYRVGPRALRVRAAQVAALSRPVSSSDEGASA